MVPIGYIFKKVVNSPAWLGADAVADIYSLSGCISEYFSDYVNYWKHNGYWLFDSPEIMEDIARDNNIDLAGTALFYYEMYEYEFDDVIKEWVIVPSELPFATDVQIPINKSLQGFDVTSFSLHTSAECSPLSCNSLAKKISVNQHCLFNTFEEAKNAIDNGHFINSEPGPYRIFAVYKPILV